MAVSERASAASRLGRSVDFLSDWAVLAYAAWTLLAYVGMATQARVSLLVPVWLVTVPLLGAVLVALARGRKVDPAEPTGRRGDRPSGPSRRGRYLLGASLAGGLASALLAAALPGVPWPFVWTPAFVAVALALYACRLRAEGPRANLGRPGWTADAFPALVGLGFAAMSLFTNNQDADDAFYVNRATATAQLDRIPVRDVLFTEERVAPVSGAGLPVDTFSALQGALANLLALEAPSVTYYLTPPLLTFLATWSLWRLLRLWAPRRAALCFALGCVYWLWSAQLVMTPGSFFLTRMWQGKVVFLAWLVPTLYVYLTRWLGRRDALTALLLVAAAVSAIGLTGSATFVAPLLFGTAALPLAARRDWRGLPLLVAAAAFPFLVGLVATRLFPLAESYGEGLPSSSWFFQSAFGLGVVAAVGAAALWASPWLARPGAPARLTSGVAVVAVLLLAPGVLGTLSDVAGITETLRRTLWILPLPALVGLLAAAPVPRLLARLGAAVPALLVAAALVGFGQPLWSSESGTIWTPRPTWKTNERALAHARILLARYEGTGPILTDPPVMKAIALLTVRPKAVNARTTYLLITLESSRRTEQRLILTRLVTPSERRPSLQEIRQALSELRVGLVCLRPWHTDRIREVKAAGPYREAFRVRARLCLARREE